VSTSTGIPSEASVTPSGTTRGSTRSDLILLALLASGVLGIGAHSGSLRDWDEAMYAEIAREYHDGGDWLSPRWNGEPWYDKPPLGMWLTALAYRLFGVGASHGRVASSRSGSCCFRLHGSDLISHGA